MRIHLGGSSRQSLVAARAKLDAAVKGATADSAAKLSSELFLAAEVLASNVPLRRAFADMSRDVASKETLVKDLFGKTLGSAALTVLTDVATLRWSAGGDIVHVLEQLAIEAEGSAANINGELDRVEDELFEISRVIAENFELRKALVGPGTTSAKSTLVSDALANRRNRLIANVRVAATITDTQKVRLAQAIEKQVGQPIRVNIQVDPSIIGGVSVKFADELVDGSISNRLAGAGRALVGNK